MGRPCTADRLSYWQEESQGYCKLQSSSYPAITVNVQCGCQKNASKAKTASYATTVSTTALVKAKNNSYYDYYMGEDMDED